MSDENVGSVVAEGGEVRLSDGLFRPNGAPQDSVADVDRIGAAERSKGGAAFQYCPITTRDVDDVRSNPAQPVVSDGELQESVEALVIAVHECEDLPSHGEPPAQLVNIDTPVMA